MNEQSTYLVQAARGPVIMITIGVLFAFDRFTEFLLRLVGGPRRRYRDYTAADAPSAPPPPPSGNYTSTQYSSSPYAGSSSDKGPEARP
jgi:hypothetical protein